jgi:hypothetical protein
MRPKHPSLDEERTILRPMEQMKAAMAERTMVRPQAAAPAQDAPMRAAPKLVQPIPSPSAAIAVASASASGDVPAAVITTRTRAIKGRPAVSWAAALVAMGVFTGLVSAVVARGDTDALLEATASFVDPAHGSKAAAAVAAPAMAMAPAMLSDKGAAADKSSSLTSTTPNAAPAATSCTGTPEPPKTVMAETKASSAPLKVVEARPEAVKPVVASAPRMEAPKVEAPVADAPKPEPRVAFAARPAPKPAPVAAAASEDKPVAVVRREPKPAAPAVVAERPERAERAEKADKPEKAEKPGKAVASSKKPTASDDDLESASAADALARAQLEASLR